MRRVALLRCAGAVVRRPQVQWGHEREKILSRYYDPDIKLYRRFWFEMKGDLLGTGALYDITDHANERFIVGWATMSPFYTIQGDVVGTLEQVSHMERWLRKFQPEEGQVEEIDVPDDRRMLFRRLMYDQFTIIYP